jgi:hypothetical protein
MNPADDKEKEFATAGLEVGFILSWTDRRHTLLPDKDECRNLLYSANRTKFAAAGITATECYERYVEL